MTLSLAPAKEVLTLYSSPKLHAGPLCMNWNKFILLLFLLGFFKPYSTFDQWGFEDTVGKNKTVFRVHPFSITSDLSISPSTLQYAVPTRPPPVFVGMTVASAEWASGLDFTVGCIFNHLGVTTLSICAPLSLTTALFLLIESALWVHQIWWGCISWHETETTSSAIANLVS